MPNEGGDPINPMLLTWGESGCGKTDSVEQKCSICTPDSVTWHESCREAAEVPSRDEGEREMDSSMAIVPVKKLDVASGSFSLLLGALPEVKPGWPLLRHAMVRDRSSSQIQQVRQISVVQWAMRLPSRYGLFIENSTRKDSDSSNHDKDHQLDGESGAIVPVGNEVVSVPLSPDCLSRSLPEELEGLHEKYSATCRLFKFRELELATSNFRKGFNLLLKIIFGLVL